MTLQGVTFCAFGGPCVPRACIREPSFQPTRQEAVTTGLTLLQQTLLERGRPLGEGAALRQLPIPVLALHRPGVPARVTGSRTGKPGARHPLQLRAGRAHAIAALAGDRVCFWSGLLGNEEAVADIEGLGGVCGKNLHDEDFLGGRVAHPVQEVVPVAPAAVVHDGPVDVDDGFRSGDHVLAVDQVLTVFLLQG